ncbi:Short-chain dehydrogenase [Entamoeba marina]
MNNNTSPNQDNIVLSNPLINENQPNQNINNQPVKKKLKQQQPHKNSKKPQLSKKRIVRVPQEIFYNLAKESNMNNVVTRQLTSNCIELDAFDKSIALSTQRYKYNKDEYSFCYGCGRRMATHHPVYVFSCMKCGTCFQKNRNLTADLSQSVSLVIGCRTKLGHQVTLKLLRAGSKVIGTTRYPNKTINLFSQYPDYEKWKTNLIIYEDGLDLDTSNLETEFEKLKLYILNTFGRLDNLIFCAAQTIRVREKERSKVLNEMKEFNRYGDAKFVKETNVNSWQMTIHDLNQTEMEEVMRINAIAPALMVKTLLEPLQQSKIDPYVIFVHAREGLFDVKKGCYHPHTNMAKAALAMLTLTLIKTSLRTTSGKKIRIHGCDPGWISVDEYYEESRPWIVPPLDEVDGAARILYPLLLMQNHQQKQEDILNISHINNKYHILYK